MRGTAALQPDFVPAGGLLRMLQSSESKKLDDRLRDRIELEGLRRQTNADLAELKDAVAFLAENYDRLAPEDADWLPAVAKKAQEREREATVNFSPVIAALKSALEPPEDEFGADVQQLLRDGIKVLEGWLAFYHGLYTMLARQAAERRPAVLRARPVEGEIDHTQLTREIIRRFPKILAELAK
jgi:hypothetical protein